MKAVAVSLYNNLMLDRLAKAIGDSGKNSLTVFFAAKTHKHKPEVPLWCIVSERDTWQLQVSRYLFMQLSTLVVDDPFATKNSLDVVGFLEHSDNIGYAFSVDVEKLFYSIPHKELFAAVKASIESSNVIAFRNKAGICVDNFFRLLEFYLGATLVSFQNDLYIQRQGICIGSYVAPVLSNIFLASIDHDINNACGDGSVLRIFRYAGDYLVLLKEQPALTYPSMAEHVLNIFRQQSKSLAFTHELPIDNCLQFADVKLFLKNKHACWMFNPRSNKALLQYDSAH